MVSLLQSEKLREEFVKLMSGMTLDVRAQIRLVPSDEEKKDYESLRVVHTIEAAQRFGQVRPRGPLQHLVKNHLGAALHRHDHSGLLGASAVFGLAAALLGPAPPWASVLTRALLGRAFAARGRSLGG